MCCGYCVPFSNPDPEYMCDPCWDFLQNPPICDCDVFNKGCICRRLEWEAQHGYA